MGIAFARWDRLELRGRVRVVPDDRRIFSLHIRPNSPAMIHFVFYSREHFDEEVLRRLGDLYERSFEKPRWRGFERDVLEKPNLRLVVAQTENDWVGFRLGYDVGAFTFRTWFLGVHLLHRRQGIAAELVSRGNAELLKEGYRSVKAHASVDVRRLYDRMRIEPRVFPSARTGAECQYSIDSSNEFYLRMVTR